MINLLSHTKSLVHPLLVNKQCFVVQSIGFMKDLVDSLTSSLLFCCNMSSIESMACSTTNALYESYSHVLRWAAMLLTLTKLPSLFVDWH